MRTSLTRGAIAAAAIGLVLATAGGAAAHINPAGTLTDTDSGTAGIQLATDTNLVLCANHSAATLWVNPISGTSPSSSVAHNSGQCRALQLQPGLYEVGGYTAPSDQPAAPCVNSSTDPNYPNCPRPFESLKVFAPNNQAEMTFEKASVVVEIPAAPTTPTYGIPNSNNLNYPTQGTNNIHVVALTFVGNPDAI